MLQVILTDKEGRITQVMTSVEELAVALNDPQIMSQRNIGDLLGYIMHNHYRTMINGKNYYHKGGSFGMYKPVKIEFVELDLPSADKRIKIVLEDKAGNVLSNNDATFAEFAALLSDGQIASCNNEADLSSYVMSHHYHTVINGENYWHKGFSFGIGHLPTFVFAKL